MTAQETGTSRELMSLLDRQEIMDRVSDLALGLDLREFQRYRRCFADEVEIRNPRFSPAAPVRSRTGDEWASSVYQTQSQLDYSLHTLTTPAIELRGDEADVTVIQQARFGLDADSYCVGGPLRLRFIRTRAGWRVGRLDFSATWSEGSRSVYDRARKAAAGAAGVMP
jgi:SnoaL-like domain